ncbi:ETS homologous factor-like [Phymastichus coffea]|uniref:ETS homologous factor-like n=1 Tax=Phymastichus coffea TaxID=108790 RepID=UPI00273CB40D|nr:ETS homologous factor-like [Phymastichus coffea]
MNPYGDFDKSDISNVVMNQEYFRTYEENEEHMLLDMDALVQRGKDDDAMMSRAFGYSESPTKKFALADEAEVERVGRSEWESKPVEDWCEDDTVNWLYTIIATMNLPQVYGTLNPSDQSRTLILPGKQLLGLGRHEFVAREPAYGDRLYGLLHGLAVANRCQAAQHSKQPRAAQDEAQAPVGAGFPRACHEDEPSAVSASSNASDAESDNSVEVSTKRPPGRPRLLKAKKNPTSQGKLWEFIRDLLRNRKTCPSLICWEDYSQAKFRFVRSDEVAKLWGSRKGNTKMTYEKLSRAMRYYYKRKIFLPVLGRRLVYQFGPNATGWQTDNPNFRF